MIKVIKKVRRKTAMGFATPFMEDVETTVYLWNIKIYSYIKEYLTPQAVWEEVQEGKI